MTPHRRFQTAFRRVMKTRGMTHVMLAHAVPCSESTVGDWSRGERIPEYELGLKAAEVLRSPLLARLIVELRTRQCLRCGRDFIVRKQLVGMYCSNRCRSTHHQQNRNARRSAERKERAGRELAIWRAVGDRVCREWCPTVHPDGQVGLCPDMECPIQQEGLCTLPVAKRAAA